VRERAEAPGMNLIDESLDPGSGGRVATGSAGRPPPTLLRPNNRSSRQRNTHQTTRYFMIKPAEDGRPS
jgi:hypothetical protein